MTIKDIINAIEDFAPVTYQKAMIMSGLQTGDVTAEATGILLTLDVTEAVIEEAVKRNCNMVVAHHPVIFSGLKGLAGRTYVERILQKAIKNDINIYAAHTNIDNMREGVNAKIAEKLGLQDTSVLSMRTDTLSKLYTYTPQDAADKVRDALFAAGAGDIGKYGECSFNANGKGTFRPNLDAKPTIGKAGGEREIVDEVKIEVLAPKHKRAQIMRALFESHPYEEVAYELIALQNPNQEIGAGMTGILPHPMEETAFLDLLKHQMKTNCIRHTQLLNKPIKKVALCGGSGSFLLKDAIAAGADIFITGDYKYHQFFDAEGKLIIADIGHYESEQFTVEIFETIFKKKFPNFAILLSNIYTNPVKYFF